VTGAPFVVARVILDIAHRLCRSRRLPRTLATNEDRDAIHVDADLKVAADIPIECDAPAEDVRISFGGSLRVLADDMKVIELKGQIALVCSFPRDYLSEESVAKLLLHTRI
jgi:hypothetical protein